jgi:hypothetical protein
LEILLESDIEELLLLLCLLCFLSFQFSLVRELILYAFLGGGPDICLHFSTTYIHTYFWWLLQRFREWESYVVRESNRKTKPRRKTKINKFMQWKLRKTSYFKKNRMPIGAF